MVSTIYRQLQELETFDSRGAAVLSLYFNTTMEHGTEADAFGEVEGLVQPLRVRVDETRQADLATELEAVRDYLGSLLCPPAALALFTCSRRHYFRVVRLPVEVVPAVYWTDHAETAPLCDAADRASGDRVGQSGLTTLI
ncbi:hypothetical protein BH23GEM9_BH23GEM9_16690 [soil metagenome]